MKPGVGTMRRAFLQAILHTLQEDEEAPLNSVVFHEGLRVSNQLVQIRLDLLGVPEATVDSMQHL